MICCWGREGGCLLHIFPALVWNLQVGDAPEPTPRVSLGNFCRGESSGPASSLAEGWRVLFREPCGELASENRSHGMNPPGLVTFFLFLCSPRMDFLVLFLFYLTVVLVGGATICVCSATNYLKGLVRGGTQVTVLLGDRWVVNVTGSKGSPVFLPEQARGAFFIRAFACSFICGGCRVLQSLNVFFPCCLKYSCIDALREGSILFFFN